MNSYNIIRVLILAIIVIMSLSACFETRWDKECDQPYLTLDDLIANKNFLLTKYEKIGMSRHDRWKRDSKYFYDFRDFEKCRVFIKYFRRQWNLWDDQNIDCNNLKKTILYCRQICDSLQIYDLFIYKLPSKAEYEFGYNLQCVDIPNFIAVNDSHNKFRFIYLINMEQEKPSFEGINSNVQSFVYKNHKFCLSEY